MSETEEELELLREFYDFWVAFHKLANSGAPRAMIESAAVGLEEASQAIERRRVVEKKLEMLNA